MTDPYGKPGYVFILQVKNQLPRSARFYLVPERKLGFFVKIKPPAHRAYAPVGMTDILTTGILVVFRGLKFECDADIGEKDSFRSGTIYRTTPWIMPEVPLNW